jgi:hypothetical protein
MTTIIYGDFHDALTGEMVTRELRAQEIAELPEPSELILGEQPPVDVVVETVADVEVVDEE